MNVKSKLDYFLLDNLHGGVYIVDEERKILYWNKAAEQISGFSTEEVVGHHCFDNILTHVDAEGRQLCTGICPLAKSMEDGQPRENEIYLHHKEGHRVPVSVRTNRLFDDEGSLIGGIELFTDLSQQEAYRLRIEELEKMAMLDNLTQLPNRHYLEKQLASAFQEKKNLNMEFGLFFMDIDHFKQFNDRYGHDVGDKVLQFVAKTFIKNARPFDIYGRWGGEEFLGIIRNTNPLKLKKIGERMRQLIANSYLLSGEEKLQITISMGAALVGDDDTEDSLLKRADSLLYKSKEVGRNCLTME